MILAICHINRRQHFVGLWATLDKAVESLGGAYIVREVPQADVADEFTRAATKRYEAVPTGEGQEAFAGDEDGFSLYEFSPGAFPGFCPFDCD